MSRQRHEPIAIIGSACRFAGSTSSAQKLWELLLHPQDLRQKIPTSRFNASGFYHRNGAYHGHSNVEHGYFLEEDPSVFDAEFFSIKAAEAKAMDPQQRILLEVVYEALESAGLPMADLKGSDTAVYVGSMTDDYANLLLRDSGDTPTYYAMGVARSILSNRVSHFYDWHGPSISVDTACSSSLVAVHMALQALRGGDTRVALACGANLILGPENFIVESKLGMLSPDGRSRMWDQGANGYARGEGVAVLVLKTLSAALEDGDHIECIIRETGLNQDGNTPGITMPNADAQAALIRSTYEKAGLNLRDPTDHPQFFEGSIKTVLGHTEGTAGVAAVLKACLALQNGIIPPNLLFERLNSEVAPFYKGIEIPLTSRPWPDVPGSMLRASVNSFGFGGTNAHAILESFDNRRKITERCGPLFTPFLFSASSQSSLAAMLRSYAEYLNGSVEGNNIHDLAWTLRRRRSSLAWRIAIVASSLKDLRNQICSILESSDASPGIKALPLPQHRVLGIFTGQGAQYVGMGSELIQSSETARAIIGKLESYLREIPDVDAPTWSLSSELKSESSFRVHEAVVSQPLCTAIQILLVELLRLGGVRLEAVVGHSSGEIAAAYAAGFIGARDAMLISYYRGLHLEKACSPSGPDVKGAMIAAGMSLDDAMELCDDKVFKGRIVVAAINSPSSVTISGDQDAIGELEQILQDEGRFYRSLQVEKAYHSPHMLPCFNQYVASLRRCELKVAQPNTGESAWFSSMNGKQIEIASNAGLGDVYWAENLTNPVQYSKAVGAALTTRPCDIVIEIGPHPALKHATNSVIQNAIGKELPYRGSLMRGKNAVAAMSSTFAFIWSYLGPPSVDIDVYERGLPSYSWKHDIEMRRDKVHPLLGHASADSASHHLIWKHLYRLSEMPWLTGHQVQGQVVFPAAGYVCAAIEAASHLNLGQSIQLVEIKDFKIHHAVMISLADISREISAGIKALFTFSAAVGLQSSEDLALVASCLLDVKVGETTATLLPASGANLPYAIEVDADRFYTSLSELGYQFNGRFRSLSSMRRKHLQSSCVLATNLLIHPTDVDASLQSIMLAYSYPYDGSLTKVHLPTTIRKIVVNPAACKMENEILQKAPITIQATVVQGKGSERCIKGHASIYTGASQHAAIQIQGAVFAPLGESTIGEDRKVFSKMRWVPSHPNGLIAARGISLLQGEDVTIELLERIAIFYLRRFNCEVAADSSMRSHLPTSAYLNFAQHVISVVASGRHKIARESWLHDTHERILEMSRPFMHFPDVEIMHLVGSKMPRVFSGEGTMLEHFRADGSDILDRYYAGALGLRQSAQWVGRSAKQIVDRYRHMNILEIGAGTGSATKAIFKEIGDNFLSYTYTDISTAFFQTATSTFSHYRDRMVFRTLDVENDPIESGFTESSYDLIVCFFVLHATRNISHCLHNIRKLLRPGGYLIVGEGQDAWEGAATMGFIFGTLPGWWVGANDGRVLSPYVHPLDWDGILKASGFSGIDTSPPQEFHEAYSVHHFVTQAVDDYIGFLRQPITYRSDSVAPIKRLVIIGGHTARTSSLVSRLQDILAGKSPAPKCHTFDTLLEVDYSVMDGGTVVLSLTDIDYPFFKDLTPDCFATLKTLFQTSKNLLWVTSGRLEDQPYSHMMVGFGRVAANETPDLRLQQLNISDPANVSPEAIVEILLRFHAGLEREKNALHTVETEILLGRDGQEQVPRVEHLQELNDRYNSKSRAVVRHVNLEASRMPVVLRSNGGSSILEELPRAPFVPPSCQSSIELCTEYSTVSAIKSTIGHGHLVLGRHLPTRKIYLTLVPSPVSSIFEAPNESVIPLLVPTTVSMSHYLSILASHLIIIVAHNAPRLIVQALSRQCKATGIAVFYTTDIASNETPDSWVHLTRYVTETEIETSLLPAEFSLFLGFSSEGTPSCDNEKRLIECLAGRCRIFTTLDRLFSLAGFDVGSRPAGFTADFLGRIIDIAQKPIEGQQCNNICSSRQIRLDALVDGVRVQSPFTIVEWVGSGSLPVHVTRLDSRLMFKGHDSTYWIVGMSRALGITLADWLISKGVANLAITSRDPDIDPYWISSHKRKGVTIAVVPCDITNEDGLKSTYSYICSLLPPIAGVIQGAMVLHDTLLRNMTFQQFQDVAGPKVDGSIHLDKLFSDKRLDFLVLVSSINCIIGNIGQANYAAANAFMCGLAAQRRRRGLPSAAVNIGAIIGAGYMMSESRKELDNIVERYLMLPMSEEDWCQAISEAIDACRPDSPHGPEIITGLRSIALDVAHAPNAPNWCTTSTFSSLIVARKIANAEEKEKALPTISERLQACRTPDEINRVVEETFASQLRMMLQVSTSSDELMAARSGDIGIDSLVSVDIRSWFLRALRVNIPVLKIMGNNAMSSLVQYAIENMPQELTKGVKDSQPQVAGPQNSDVESNREEPLESRFSSDTTLVSASPPQIADITEMKKPSRIVNLDAIDWQSESSPPTGVPTMPTQGTTLPVQSPPHTIVLTGCTGFLGYHLLSHILHAEPPVKRIICIAVRSLKERMNRCKALSRDDARVEYYEGDLSDGRLGLSEIEAASIFTSADAVIHNGADTSHLKHYADIRASNVGSTVELARLCIQRRIPLHYISSAGVGVFHTGSATAGFAAGPVKITPGMEPDGSFGYGCSKWVCEMMLERTSALYGLGVLIYRPSTILRDGDDAVGPAAQRDWVNAFLLYTQKLKAVPEMKRRVGALDFVHVETKNEKSNLPFTERGRDSDLSDLHHLSDLSELSQPFDYTNYSSDSTIDFDPTDTIQFTFNTMTDTNIPEKKRKRSRSRNNKPSNLPTAEDLNEQLPQTEAEASNSSTLRRSEEDKLESQPAEESDDADDIENTTQRPTVTFTTNYPTTMPPQHTSTNRLDENDYDIKIQASKLVKSGSGFNNVPKLKDGGSNWNDFNTALHDAALGEGVMDILSGTFKKPIVPFENCTDLEWNKYVKKSIYWETMNNHLLAGIRGKLDTTIRQEQDISDETDAYAVYRQLTTYCQQRGANHLLDLTYSLAKKNLPQMKGIDEYNKHWIDTCQAMDSLQLKWRIPDQLKQLWYMANLGDAFDTWKTSMTTSYAIADVGTGTPVSLKDLMSMARDHWAKLAGNAKRNASTMAAFHLDEANSDNEVYFSPDVKRRRLNDKNNNERRHFIKKEKPANYTGPYQKVCSIHGWSGTADGNHDDSTCRTLIARKARGGGGAYHQDSDAGTIAVEQPKPDNLPTIVNPEGHYAEWEEAMAHLAN
ncbi:putative polyketide synthase [Nemania sp. FL0031]|nr:putative polyketide synthase [Nemania sp. FL0031]